MDEHDTQGTPMQMIKWLFIGCLCFVVLLFLYFATKNYYEYQTMGRVYRGGVEIQCTGGNFNPLGGGNECDNTEIVRNPLIETSPIDATVEDILPIAKVMVFIFLLFAVPIYFGAKNKNN